MAEGAGVGSRFKRNLLWSIFFNALPSIALPSFGKSPQLFCKGFVPTGAFDTPKRNKQTLVALIE